MSFLQKLGNVGRRLIDVARDRYPDSLLYFRALALRSLMMFTLVTVGLTVIFLLVYPDRSSPQIKPGLLLSFPILALAGGLYWIAGRGGRGMAIAGWVGIPVLLLTCVAGALANRGIMDPALTGCYSLLVLAALLIGNRGLAVTTGLSLLAIAVLEYRSQVHPPPPADRLILIVHASTAVMMVIFIAVVLSLWNQIHAALLLQSVRSAEEQQRATARAEALGELDRQKTAFLGNVSHEFRTPLTLSIELVKELLSDPALPAGHRHDLDVVRRNNRRLLKLVNSLLDMASIEAGRLQAAYGPVELGSLTRALAGEFQPAMERGGLRYVVDCPSLPEPVFVDRAMWERIVFNLLSNALKFTLQGEVRVSLRAEGHNAVLEVRDTGCGVPAEELPHLFDRFHRVRGTVARTHDGSGLGLALVQELVKLHRGTIEARSVVGQGTTFTVRLPFGAEHLPRDRIAAETTNAAMLSAAPYVEEALHWMPEGPGPAAGADSLIELPALGAESVSQAGPAPAVAVALPADKGPGAPGPARGHVLLAEDDADMREYLVRLLRPRYEVTSVADGQDALAALQRRPADLVLCDAMMPRLDGLSLVRELRKDPRTRGLPVVLISARAGEESKVEGLEQGADDYLPKPFSSRELLARVRGQLQLARQRREAIEAREQLIRLVAHDLRTPLTVLHSYAQLLRKRLRDGDPMQATALDSMERASVRMMGQIEDLLDMTAIETGKVSLKLGRVDLAKLCRDMATDLMSSQDRKIRLAVPSGPVWIEADARRIGQVLSNLLGNAFKYAGPDRPVALSLTTAGGAAVVMVMVRDEGPGIPPEHAARIFEPFYRVPGAEQHEGGGLGLGLAICRDLIERHGGAIRVESEVGKGSAFVITLPLAPP